MKKRGCFHILFIVTNVQWNLVAVTTTTAATISTAAAATASTATASAIFTRTSLVDLHRAAIDFFSVQTRHSGFRFRII